MKIKTFYPVLLLLGTTAFAAEWGLDAGTQDQINAIVNAARQTRPKTSLSPEEWKAQKIYNTLFPYYAEVCALTRYQEASGEAGGKGGHAVLFLNGACRDDSSEYPRLRACADDADLSDPESGVGISLDNVFGNVSWVAIPGRSVFYRGQVGPDQRIDQAAVEEQIRLALAGGWFKGIEPNKERVKKKPEGMDPAEFMARKTLGTDFALTFARETYGARLPLSRQSIAKVVDNLNSVNEKSQREGFEWHPLNNNCSQLVHNALAAAGIFQPKTIRGLGHWNEFLLFAASLGKIAVGEMPDFSFPPNNLVRVSEMANQREINDVIWAYSDEYLRNTLESGWITTRPGGLIVHYPMHPPEKNDKFIPGGEPFMFSVPLLWPKRARYETLTKNTPEYLSDLRANLLFYQRRYKKSLDSRYPLEDYLASDSYFRWHDPVGRENFTSFYGKFYSYLEAQSLAVAEMLREYDRLAR